MGGSNKKKDLAKKKFSIKEIWGPEKFFGSQGALAHRLQRHTA